MHALTLVLASALATSPPAPPPPACTAPEHRQFDFWIGQWEVWGGAEGKTLLGRNRIAQEAGGCALHEHWQGARGISGMSLSAWDAQRRAWTQFWVGGDGLVLRLQGGLEGGAMVMRGELPSAAGGVQQQRITWTPQEDGSVEQRWETSDDGGKTWAVSFLGRYARKP